MSGAGEVSAGTAPDQRTAASGERPAAANPALTSWYVDEAFYERAQADVARLGEIGVPAEPARREEAERLLVHEAWLLDEGRFDDWLALMAPECLYWMPSTLGGDPREQVTLAFDDRRRLEDRVFWLRSAYVWSQIPRSRTRRMITNVEVLRGDGDDELLVRSNFVVFDVRPGYRATHPGWYGHVLRREDGPWRIAIKQVNLADADQAHPNLSILF